MRIVTCLVLGVLGVAALNLYLADIAIRDTPVANLVWFVWCLATGWVAGAGSGRLGILWHERARRRRKDRSRRHRRSAS